MIEDLVISPVVAHTAAGTSDVTGTFQAVAGCKEFIVIARFGTGAANNTVTIADSDTDSGYVTIAGSTTASSTAKTTVIISVKNPQKRYIRVTIARGTSSTVEHVTVLQKSPSILPHDNTTTAVAVKMV